jgi:hypothetical protein
MRTPPLPNGANAHTVWTWQSIPSSVNDRSDGSRRARSSVCVNGTMRCRSPVEITSSGDPASVGDPSTASTSARETRGGPFVRGR